LLLLREIRRWCTRGFRSRADPVGTVTSKTNHGVMVRMESRAASLKANDGIVLMKGIRSRMSKVTN